MYTTVFYCFIVSAVCLAGQVLGALRTRERFPSLDQFPGRLPAPEIIENKAESCNQTKHVIRRFAKPVIQALGLEYHPKLGHYLEDHVPCEEVIKTFGYLYGGALYLMFANPMLDDLRNQNLQCSAVTAYIRRHAKPLLEAFGLKYSKELHALLKDLPCKQLVDAGKKLWNIVTGGFYTQPREDESKRRRHALGGSNDADISANLGDDFQSPDDLVNAPGWEEIEDVQNKKE